MTETEILERVQKAIDAYSVRRVIDASHPRAADTRVFIWPANAPDAEVRGGSGTPNSRLELLVTIDVGSASMESDFDEIWSVTFLAGLAGTARRSCLASRRVAPVGASSALAQA